MIKMYNENQVHVVNDMSTNTKKCIILAYTYYNRPWEMKSGDDVRIHTLLKSLALATGNTVIAFHLTAQNNNGTPIRGRVVYVAMPRRFYNILARIVGWKNHYDLNPLMKITHYIDELIAITKIAREAPKGCAIVVLGSMTLASFFLRTLKTNIKIIYDSLANYAQTLYLRSRRSSLELLRYGVYLALHRLQLSTSNLAIYPSNLDSNTARHMFNLIKAIVVPNPAPVCYNSLEEYLQLRRQRKDDKRPYFILLAGGRGRTNEEAVRHTIEVFNKLPPNRFILLITGPWNDHKSYVRNRSINILGIVPHEQLKELLATADYGLSPIFSHAAGTFMKILAYQAADLNIIASPHSLLGLEIKNPRKIRVVHNYYEYVHAVEETVHNHQPGQQRSPLLCEERDRTFQAQLSEVLRQL